MKHPSPVKSGLAMFVGAALLFVCWFINREATILLVMAIAATLWGILWVVLHYQTNVSAQREREAPAYQPPKKGKWVTLSRVRQGFKQGWLVTDHRQIFFYKGSIKAKPGENLALPADAFTPILALAEIHRFRHVAGLWGGGTLELYGEAGACHKFHLQDPEGLPLLLNVLESP